MAVSLDYTPISEIPTIHATLKKTFKDAVTRPLDYRRHQLLQLARMIQENADIFYAALDADLHKQKLEAASQELGPIVRGSIDAANSLEEWTKPQVPPVEDWKASFNTKILKVPKGAVLIIAPWNYPVILCLQPLIGAIAAGCPAAVKPSEVAPHIAQVLADLFPKYLDVAAYSVINGGIDETTEVLKLSWDHIFYTGNGRVGRIIATAAANHLTPCTLELGGQSPVVVDETADLHLAAKRILWGKSQNAGQLCVSPNHVIVVRSKQDEFVNALRRVYSDFWPKGPLHPESSFGRIVSPHHYKRVESYLSRTKGTVVLGGQKEPDRGMETTIVKDVKFDDSLLEEEIFGPLLAIVPVDSVDDAINWINDHDTPLVLYVFTQDENVKQKFARTTNSGSLIFNDAVGHLSVYEIPFGGHGASGYGYQHSIFTFDTFTHLRSSIDVPDSSEPILNLRYAPYTEEALQQLGATVTLPIPSSVSPILKGNFSSDSEHQ